MDSGKPPLTSHGCRCATELHYLGGIFVAAGEKKCSEWGNLGLVVIRTSFLITTSPRLPLTEHMAGHTVSWKWRIRPPCHMALTSPLSPLSLGEA